MPKTKQQKKEIVEKISQKLPKAKIIIFTSFAKGGEKGLSVSQTQELKRNLKKTDSEYVISRKTLIDVALNKASYSGVLDVKKFEGSLGLAFGYDDIISTSKTVYAFSKANKAMQLLGAVMGKEFIGSDKLIELARLPGREVLISKIVGLIKSPLSGLANVLQGNLKNLVLVLSNIHPVK